MGEKKVQVKVKLKNGACMPVYCSKQAAGADLCAFLPDAEEILIRPMERKLIPTGISISLPEGWEAQIRPRSGLALKKGITVLNTPGTIDSDYRGELKVLLINLSFEDFTVSHGERIAQMIIAPCCRADFTECDFLDETERGVGGYGSTGL